MSEWVSDFRVFGVCKIDSNQYTFSIAYQPVQWVSIRDLRSGYSRTPLASIKNQFFYQWKIRPKAVSRIIGHDIHNNDIDMRYALYENYKGSFRFNSTYDLIYGQYLVKNG